MKRLRTRTRKVARQAAKNGVDLSQAFRHYDWHGQGFIRRRFFLRALDLCLFIFTAAEAEEIARKFEAVDGSVVNYNKFLRWAYPVDVRVDMVVERVRAVLAEHATRTGDFSATFIDFFRESRKSKSRGGKDMGVIGYYYSSVSISIYYPSYVRFQ